MADRRRLPNRRASRIVKFEHGNIEFDVEWSPWPETIALSPSPAEIFVTPRVSENHLHQECAAFSTMVSHALQQGAKLKDLYASLPKHSSGKPTTWGGESLAAIIRDIQSDEDILPTRSLRDIFLEAVLTATK